MPTSDVVMVVAKNQRGRREGEEKELIVYSFKKEKLARIALIFLIIIAL